MRSLRNVVIISLLFMDGFKNWEKFLIVKKISLIVTSAKFLIVKKKSIIVTSTS